MQKESVERDGVMRNSRECSQKFLLEAIGLASVGIKGASIEWNISDWDSVCKLIAKHRLIPYVACALIASPNLDCPTSAREYMLNRSICSIMTRYINAKVLHKKALEGLRAFFATGHEGL